MTLQETAKELNNLVKTEREKSLESKIEQLEKVIINLNSRVDYLESQIGK